MVQGIHNTGHMQGTRNISQEDQGYQYYATKPYEDDSFNGKTLVKVAAVAGAIVFRRNIGRMIKKFLPSVYNWTNKNVSKHVTTFVRDHKENTLIKYPKWLWDKTGSWGKSATRWIGNKYNSAMEHLADKIFPS